MLEDNEKENKFINEEDDISFRSISKEDKIKYFNPLYLTSPLFKLSTLFFILILCCLLVSIWFIKIDIIYLVICLILFQLLYIFLSFYIIKVSLKLSLPNLSNKLFLNKHELIPILKYKDGLIIIDENS